ncbi:CRAL/TRIO domain protein [Akanthomyces lecanii RCEF 1005]|uniref:CRAL/TRIO domain protein n=1 Tax=Akanthomyces lecanii RCEF 1005 TaxID=1081108 RepID=A0A168F9N1_CORDF|nr:CRAL/TRIO domain protein [Akanthomyces lecanii RCEF 1005]
MSTTATTTIPEGNVGNLTTQQEAKLRQFWGTIFKLYDLYESKDPEVQAALKNCATQANAPVQKSRFGLFGGGKKASAEDTNAIALVEKQLGLGAADENDKFGLRKQFMEMLSKHSAESARAMILEAVKHDHPDALALRFLRARKWEVDKGIIMMFSAMDWRTSKSKVDSDIMYNGEGGGARDEKSSDPNTKVLAHDFMRQLRMGKGFLHGTDKEGRPISYVRARLHKPFDGKNESLERFIVYNIETGRMVLNPPIETACLVFDLTGFTLANLDYVPIKYIIQSFEANYPESLGVILVHNAPWVFKSVWKIIHGWLDPVVASKVHFTNGRDGADGITNHIAPDRLIKELGGDLDWEYKYVEPVEGENDIMKDTATRDRLQAERQEIANRFEAATRKWVEASTPEINAERASLAKELCVNYWKLDPYIRARSLYDRNGNMRGGKKVAWYEDEKAAAAAEDKAADNATVKSEETFVDAGTDGELAATAKAVDALNIDEKTPLPTTTNAVAA